MLLTRFVGETVVTTAQSTTQGIPVAICQPSGQIRANHSYAITLAKQPDNQTTTTVLTKGKKNQSSNQPLLTPVKVNQRKPSASRQKDASKAKSVSSAPGSVKRIYQTQQQQQQKTVVNVSQTPELTYFQTTPAQSAAQRNEYVRLTQEQASVDVQASQEGNGGGGGANQENSDAQNALIKRLLGAEKVDVQKSTVKGSNNAKIEHVSISELKTLGISLQHQNNSEQANSAINSPVSVKSEGSSSSTTPTQMMPSTSTSAATVDVKQEHLEMKHEKREIKAEFKEKLLPQHNQQSSSSQKGTRKRKQSVDAKSTKKRKLKQDEQQAHGGGGSGGGVTLPALTLAEAPIRRNIDSLPPLGGGTVSKLGRDWDGLGSKEWQGEWNFGGWIQSSLHFYDAFRFFNL